MDKLTLFHSKITQSNKFSGIKPGWTIKVFQRIKEGERTRTQAFEGTVIARKHGDQPNGTITVRKVSGGIGVEKTFPLFLPSIDRIEVLKKTKTKRAKLFYLRDKSSKEIRRKIKSQQNISTTKEPAAV